MTSIYMAFGDCTILLAQLQERHFQENITTVYTVVKLIGI